MSVLDYTDYLEYIDFGKYVMLYRIYGGGCVVELPAYVAGLPVRELADHIFAPEASVLYSSSRIHMAVRRGHEYLPVRENELPEHSELTALCGSSIQEVRIPEGVEGLGNYAFYACYELKKICFPASLRRIGSGCFTACPAISRIIFETADGETPYLMGETMGALTYEIEARVTWQGHDLWRLVFPEYFEESKENTPARIIEIIWHGMGYQYRNCFLNRRVQFQRYDELFPLSIAQESPETCRRIAMDRIRSYALAADSAQEGNAGEGISPGLAVRQEAAGGKAFAKAPDPRRIVFERALAGCRLSGDARQRYVEYLRSDAAALAGELLAEEEGSPLEDLKCLYAADFFTSSNIDIFADAASERRRADAVSYLMNLKRTHFPQERKRKYDL